MENTLDKVISLTKRRGFVYSSGEIYGGTRSAWDYGPLGVLLKENIKKEWVKSFVSSRLDMVMLDSSVILPPKVWEASGHISTFVDPLVESLITHKRYRADHLIEAYEAEHGHKPENGLADIKDPETGEKGKWSEIRQFSGLMKTYLGPVDNNEGLHYLRPETAQGIFINFLNILNTSRKKPPFGVAQIGKAFRNEITPGNFIFRTREFEQMEIEYFVSPAESDKYFNQWVELCYNWFLDYGIKEENIRKFDVPEADRAHYSKATSDIEYRFGFVGSQWGELMGIANRGDFDLSNHSQHSNADLVYFNQASGEKYIPHVIEPSFGLTRSLMAFLCDAYTEEELINQKGEKDIRTVLKLDKRLAPIKIAVLPLSKKDELINISKTVIDILIKDYEIDYDISGAIGRRYRRQDEIGTPYCITLDFDSLEDNAATVRDRDTMLQERVSINKLKNYFAEKFNA